MSHKQASLSHKPSAPKMSEQEWQTIQKVLKDDTLVLPMRIICIGIVVVSSITVLTLLLQ
jgi:hypothetical protein